MAKAKGMVGSSAGGEVGKINSAPAAFKGKKAGKPSVPSKPSKIKMANGQTSGIMRNPQ
jgi:hypothetical protein